MANDFQILVKALIQASDLQGQLTALQDKLKPLKINLDLGGLKSGGIEKLSPQLQAAAKSTEEIGKQASNLGTKFTEVTNDAGTLVKIIKETKDGLYNTTRQVFDLDAATGKWLLTTTEISDGIKKQADSIKENEQAIKRKLQEEERAWKQHEAATAKEKKEQENLDKLKEQAWQKKEKQEQDYQAYLQKELQLRETIEDKADRLLNQFDDSKNKAYQKYLQNLTKENERYGKVQEQATAKARENESVLGALEIKVRSLTSAQKEQLNIESRLAAIKSTKSITEKSTLMKELNRDISAVTGNMNTFRATIDFTIERFLQIGLIMAVLRKIKEAFSDMIENVKELDKSLVEVQKVTNLEGESLEQFTRQAYEVGDAVARTGKEVIDATAIFARSGYEIKDALDLSEVALVMMNVGDGIDDISTAATSLISVLKGYNLEAEKAMDVTSLINEVSNNAAVNFEDLTEGLTRTAAVFNQSGVSIENLAGLLTGANEILQNIKFKIRYFKHGAYVQKCA